MAATKPKILVVDDEASMRRSLVLTLSNEAYAITEAGDGATAIDVLGKDIFDLVIADLKMEGLSGLDLLRHVKQANPDTEFIIMTAFGSVDVAVEAMRFGAYDFITKPFQNEEMLQRIHRALEHRRLRTEVHHLRARAASASGVEAIVGVSAATQRVVATIRSAAATDSTVLLTGESGTGKELVARALHDLSRRAGGPFVPVNCAEFPDTLIEDALFGHAKGAHSEARVARKGLMEEAQGGTFLLDEIGELPPSTQVTLLRVLEERSVRRLGDNRGIPVDLRVVASTNSDLETAVRNGTFRKDLFYRLNVIRIHLPPLRERREDIPLLARHFLTRYARHHQATGFSPDALSALSACDFPGNVRELSNVVEQAVALSTGSIIEARDLPAPLNGLAATSPASPAPAPLGPAPKTLDALTRDAIIAGIKVRNGNMAAVAQDLGISRVTLWRRMKKYKIEIDRVVSG